MYALDVVVSARRTTSLALVTARFSEGMKWKDIRWEEQAEFLVPFLLCT